MAAQLIGEAIAMSKASFDNTRYMDLVHKVHTHWCELPGVSSTLPNQKDFAVQIKAAYDALEDEEEKRRFGGIMHHVLSRGKKYNFI